MTVLHCYCQTTEVEELTMLCCQHCKKYFHLGCLKRDKPSPLEGDVLFQFVCSICRDDGFEQCTRLKLQWTHVVMLALYNLQLQGVGKCGYFRWREHVCNFIDKHWTVFFGFSRKKTNTWHGTVAGTLSAGCPRYFTSGFQELKEAGWWKLTNLRPPTQRDIAASATGCGGHRNIRKIYSEVPNVAGNVDNEEEEPRIAHLDSSAETVQTFENVASVSKDLKNDVSLKGDLQLLSGLVFTDDDVGDELDIDPGSVSPIAPSPMSVDQILNDVQACMGETGESDKIKQEAEGELDSDDNSSSFHVPLKKTKFHKQAKECEERPIEEGGSLPKKSTLVGISIYEEKQLLHRLEALKHAMNHSIEARRLRRKLILRKQKRERNMPSFNVTSYLNPEKEKSSRSIQTKIIDNSPREFRILDRYHTCSRKLGLIHTLATTFITKLVGTEGTNLEDITSPYTTRVLKPFIWRDYESQPPKLRLLQDIVKHCWRHSPSEMSTLVAPIDYCYVRPQHIPPINSLCREFFWPGIDLSESLRYPDFSCVALYRKVVVGFAFMVPDVKYNEAYISFVFTHPEWRGAGIATFMLYHLIQTCMGKDVTLHVSATNPALILYQKFGFKVEEFVMDFYDKYFPIESKECKHAMFLRLSR